MSENMNENVNDEVIVNEEVNETETVMETAVECADESTEKTGGFAASFKTLNFRGGIYALAISAIAIALVIIVNLVAGKMNINIDLTETGLYTLSDKTVEFVSTVEDEIKIYYFKQTGTEYPEIDQVLERFDGLNKKIELVEVDPILHPNYASALVGAEAAATLQYNSVIVSNETNGRSKIVLASEMILTTLDYVNYTQTYTSDVEGQIGAAIKYVTSEELPVMYVMGGHNEVALTDTQKSLFLKNNIELKDYSATTGAAIPEECDILFINYPEYDFTQAQVDAVKAYLVAGGKAVINLDYMAAYFTNLKSLLNYYGVEIIEGIVYETDARYYAQNLPYCLYPQMAQHTITENVIDTKSVFVPQATGLRVLKTKRDTITATELLVTSEDAYSKVDLYSLGENKTEEDIDGPFAAGVCIEETYQGVETTLLVYTSYLWDDVIISENAYGNKELLLDSINYLAELEGAFYAPTQNLNQQVPTWNLTGAQLITHVALKLVLLPLVCLVIGGVIAIRRRRAK